MSVEGSVTQWIDGLKAGDQNAAQRLWERYVDRLIRLAQRKLGGTPRRMADEEDVVIVAFENFCRGALEGRFSKLEDRQDLWRLLVLLTDRRSTDQMRRSLTRQKVEVGESHLGGLDSNQSASGDARQVAGSEPTPEFAALVTEEFRRLLDALGDDTLRQIVQWKMECYTNDEIAKKLGCVTRTVERKLEMIRERMQAVGPAGSQGA